MKKKILTLFFTFISFFLYSGIKLSDYNTDLEMPFSVNPVVTADQSADNKTAFSFKIGKIDGDISIFGYWKLKIGYGLGFTTYPDFAWILNVPNMNSGIIFEQERVFALDWITDSGINLHLFFNDDINATEYTFKYNVGKIFNGLYITNKFNGLEVNPYRTLKGGKAQDINFGFDWQYKFYKGRFDMQFDSVKKVTDTFRGNKKSVVNRFLSSRYVRGVYFYLPDTNITGNLEVYVSDDYGEFFNDIPSSFPEARRYRALKENTDFKIDPVNGFLTFKESVYGKTVLVYYQTNVGGHIYNVGDSACGKNGLHGTTDFNKSSYPSYFTTHNSRYYLALNFQKDYSEFEEENSYRISSPGTKVSNLNFDVFDNTSLKLSGFSGIYDEFGGCLRITRNSQKGVPDNVYPFNGFETYAGFYQSFNSPNDSFSKNRIEYSCLISGQGMKLSSKPVESSIRVFLNSVEIFPGQYSYDYITLTLTLTMEIGDTDIIEVNYVTDENDSYNMTAVLKNDFRLNDFLILGDSIWYKMPLKLWEDSYYFKLHSMEFMYNIHLTGDFKKLLNDQTAKFGFETNATFSLFQPELKGITIVEDFEYQLKGLALDLDYKKWFPVTYPLGLSITGYGKLYFRNMHKYGIKTNNTYTSLYDGPPSADAYSDGSNIGPYSSSDGYYGEKNSVSVVTEFELAQNQAVSISIPLNNDKDTNYSAFSELVAAIKAVDMTGSVALYIDAGETSEIFNTTDGLVQKETLDEGLRYQDPSGGFHLYKGKSDGINSTNDFNGNGILDGDGSNLSQFADNSTGLYYVTINGGEKKIVNFKLLNADALKTIRALRLTVYNPNPATASGKLLFNQLRFTETGWEYDRTHNSDAVEIYPAEDPLLADNIFSKKNPDFDKRLHIQRVRERTMRIRLEDDETVSLSKKFITPLEISYFKKFGFFIMAQNVPQRTVKVTLRDTSGRDITFQTDLSGIQAGQWKQLEYYFDQASGYGASNKTIGEMIIEFSNPGAGTAFNKIFIDEFYMDESSPLVGFGTKNTFEYSQPGLNIKKGDFSVFQSPSFKMVTGFNTENFVKDEMNPYKGYLLDNDIASSFRAVSIDFFTQSTLDFVFKNSNYYNPLEILRLKMSRASTAALPLLFTVYYDYKKSGIPDTTGNYMLSSASQERHLFLEAGVQNKTAVFKGGYDIDTTKRTVSSTVNRINGELKLTYLDITANVLYSISNTRQRNFLNGNFSLDNLGYVFSEDFTSFGYDGTGKSQNFEINSGFKLIPEIKFFSDIQVKNNGYYLNYNSNYAFQTDYTNRAGFELQTTYRETSANFFVFELSRNISNSIYKSYDTLHWYDYFSNFKGSISYLTPVFFYPLFSSVFKTDGRYYFDDGTRFGLLSDNLKFTFDWSLYLDRRFFLPYKFIYNVIETITNTVFYSPGYNFIFSLAGKGEAASDYFKKIELEYVVAENIGVLKDNNDYKTQTSVVLDFLLFNGLDIETAFDYDIAYTEGFYKKEFHHSIALKTKIYKDFLKKNLVTDDKSGIELTFLTELHSDFYHRLDELTEMTDNPLRIYFTPSIGYRFNRNITISFNTVYGYSMDYYQRARTEAEKMRHNFGLEISVEGVMNF
jgi:hypothetical protein